MDGRGRFMDNIFIERLWRSIKYEEVHLKAYADGREARDGIGLDDFYNHRRPHQAMNNQMPMDVWRDGMDKNEAAARAVDMPLRLDNANALPTYPQQKQQESGLKILTNRKDKGRRPLHLNSNGPWSHEWGPVHYSSRPFAGHRRGAELAGVAGHHAASCAPPGSDSAISANSVGYSLSRAVGPALGGIVIAALGISAPFWVFWASNVGIVAALLWWRSPRKSGESLPAERLSSAVRMGIRYAANNRYVGATLIRTVAFFPFASAYWALLPLIARSQTDQGPEFYGVLMGAIGVGAVAGSFAQNRLKVKLGPDRAVALGTLVTAFALVLFGLARDPFTAICACLLAGAAWTVVLTSLYVSTQVELPDWVRGRGLAIFLTVIFGATRSAAWPGGSSQGWKGCRSRISWLLPAF